MTPRHVLSTLANRLGVAVPACLLLFTGISGSIVGLGLAVPVAAAAYATPEAPPIFSAAPGLPDGRVYEQVSPADKNGNQAGAQTISVSSAPQENYGYATADGNSLLFEGNGPIGESPWAGSEYFVATKNQEGTAGWSTRALLPRAQQSLASLGGDVGDLLNDLYPSPDLSHALVVPGEGTLAPSNEKSCGTGKRQLYLTGPDPFVAATWLELGSSEACPSEGVPVGGTPDFSTVYFTSESRLLGEDASRAPEAWGFYEDAEGSLREAGVLPDGEPDEFGAVPAASGHGRNIVGNQVADEGKRAFFVSPDPAAVGACKALVSPPPGGCAPQLYVRKNGEETVLVSQDTLLPTAEGLPVGAPAGVLQMLNSAYQSTYTRFQGSYIFASSDGSQAFFQSDDRLTAAAPEGTEPKTYDFDVETGELTYLPGVAGEIVATDPSGSSLAFVRPESGGEPAELDLWSAGAEGNPAGGTVTTVVRLPGPPSSGRGTTFESNKPLVYVHEARMSGDGSVLVFTTNTPLSSAFNSGGQEEIYRYDVPAGTLGCVSCAPAGVTPRGPAAMTQLQAAETYEAKNSLSIAGMADERGMSANGDRIFFDSPDPLVKQDANTDSPPQLCAELEKCLQGRDVYEWENGVVYLISTGKSSRNSYLLDSSENGSDVFFATTEGLVPGDTDGSYDVYDARIPHPGDNPPAAAVPCEGAVCQGPPNVPSPLTPPASATFSGLGNPAPETAATPTVVPEKKVLKCPKGKKLNHGKCVKNKKKARKSSNNRRSHS